jgi:hypothetical protein
LQSQATPARHFCLGSILPHWHPISTLSSELKLQRFKPPRGAFKINIGESVSAFATVQNFINERMEINYFEGPHPAGMWVFKSTT